MVYIQKALVDNNRSLGKRAAPNDAVLATNPAYYASLDKLVPEVAYVATATVAADTTLTDAHCYVRINADSGNVNLTLPAASYVTGKLLKFFRTDGSSNKVTLTGTVNGELNPASDEGGVASPLYMQYGQMTIISNGTSWDAC